MRTEDFVPWLMNRARDRKGWRSDRQMALHMGISTGLPTQWRTGPYMPSDEHVMKLSGYAEIPPDLALLAVNMLRSGGKPSAVYANVIAALGYDLAGMMAAPTDSRNAA